jgi:hypothetical protein
MLLIVTLKFVTYDEEERKLVASLFPDAAFGEDGYPSSWYDKKIVPAKDCKALLVRGKLEVHDVHDTDILQLAQPPVAQHLNIAISGTPLHTINTVKVLTDCCTNTLDDMLRGGWRILAVCPQPEQRRPDYVLGRTN